MFTQPKPASALRVEGTDLYLNFAVVRVSAATFHAWTIPYESHDQLSSVRSEYRDSHVLSVRGNDIVAASFVATQSFPGVQREFTVRDHPSLVTSLLRASVIRFIHGNGLKLLRDRPPTFMNRQSNLLHKAVENSTTHPLLSGLAIYPTYSIDPRTIYRRREEPFFGLQLNSRLSVDITPNVAELISHGVPVINRYVVGESEQRPLRDFELNRDERSTRRILGRIVRIDGSRLVLDDALGDEVVDATTVFLEPRFENFMDCLSRVAVRTIGRVRADINREQLRYVSAPGKLKMINMLADRLRAAGPLPLTIDLQGSVEDLLRPTRGQDGGEYRTAVAPRFVFDVARTKTHEYPRVGLNQFGPFDIETFPAKRAAIVVIMPDDYRGATELFMRKFKEGLPGEVWGKGFQRKYHLADCTFHFEPFSPTFDEATGYRDACLRALQKAKKPHLAIVIVEDRHKLLSGDDNPYLVSKSVLMSQGVPVQEINIETIRQMEAGLPYTLDTIALASYAKMGGTPFVIATTQALAHELIIGVGSAVIKSRRIGASERVVGITTVFSADGNYLFSTASSEVEYERYPEELLSTLREVVETVRKRNAWQKGDDVRLIFHVFKPLKDLEARAVKSLVEKLAPTFRVEYAFVHVNSSHDWFLFDRMNAGIKTTARQSKGEHVPRRGVVLPLGSRDVLLTIKGASELKTAFQGLPRPLLLQLHRESTFTDIDYLADQIFKFTGISWRKFLPDSQPVTIAYSEQIAKLLGRLRHVKNWNPDILPTELRLSRWFL